MFIKEKSMTNLFNFVSVKKKMVDIISCDPLIWASSKNKLPLFNK